MKRSKKTKSERLTPAHIVHSGLLNPPNPVRVNVIGAGGTGSQVITALSRINHSLVALDHPGLQVRLFDHDTVTEANLGRQLFARSELGLYKSDVIISRINRFFGTGWQAVPNHYDQSLLGCQPDLGMAQLTISCVDTAQARIEIASILARYRQAQDHGGERPKYWMDFGNGRDSGQLLLSTVESIRQPASEKFHTVGTLPLVTEEFKSLMAESDTSDDTPSCSLAEALTRQDLFINSTLANLGASLLWNLFRDGLLFYRGFFLNLRDFRCQPIRIAA